MANFESSIKKDGPFFRSDPKKTVRQNIHRMMDAVAEEGAADVVARLRSGQGSRKPISGLGGRVSSHVVGRTHSLSGKPWDVTAVVSVNNRGLTRRDGIALMAAASRLEGTIRPFRKMTTQMRKARAVNVDELLKDLT